MGGNKPKRSRAQRIYFVGPAKMREHSKLEGRDADETLDEIKPLTWKEAQRALKTMFEFLDAKEPYAIFKMVPVQIKKPLPVKLHTVSEKPMHSLAARLITSNLSPGKVIKNGRVEIVKAEKKQSMNFSRSELRRRALLKQK